MTEHPEAVLGAISAAVGLVTALYKRQARREASIDHRLRMVELSLARIEAKLGEADDRPSRVGESVAPEAPPDSD